MEHTLTEDQKREAIHDLRMLHEIDYMGFNICYKDGIYANWVKQKWNMGDLSKLADLCGYTEKLRARKAALAAVEKEIFGEAASSV